MLSERQQLTKRLFDIVASVFGLIVFLLPMLFLIFLATFFTGKNGLFSQKRIGKNAKVFTIFKIRSMKYSDEKIPLNTFGKILRASKLDELPQLFNVLFGDMSIVGPRPDIKGYADELTGDDRIILSIRPGLTGPATLKYKNEEMLLAKKINPKEYNDLVIWPDKVKINKEYVKNWSLINDIKYIIQTIFT